VKTRALQEACNAQTAETGTDDCDALVVLHCINFDWAGRRCAKIGPSYSPEIWTKAHRVERRKASICNHNGRARRDFIRRRTIRGYGWGFVLSSRRPFVQSSATIVVTALTTSRIFFSVNSF
jgi:hypothetical protein